MAGPIRCTVVSPEMSLFQGHVRAVVVPGAAGELGILRMHASLVAALGPGIVRLTNDDGSVERFGVRGGLVKVKDDDVAVLVTESARVEDLDIDQLHTDLERTVHELQSPGSEERFKDLLDHRRWLEICIRLYEDSRAGLDRTQERLARMSGEASA